MTNIAAALNSDWGTWSMGTEEKIEMVQQPGSFILTCEYCGRSTRVKDNFSCPACGAPFNMKFVGSLPMNFIEWQWQNS
jgi:hypothetical protein